MAHFSSEEKYSIGNRSRLECGITRSSTLQPELLLLAVQLFLSITAARPLFFQFAVKSTVVRVMNRKVVPIETRRPYFRGVSPEDKTKFDQQRFHSEISRPTAECADEKCVTPRLHDTRLLPALREPSTFDEDSHSSRAIEIPRRQWNHLCRSAQARLSLSSPRTKVVIRADIGE